MWC
jgi:arginine/serine-rich splicing factor 4/5/6